MFCVAELVEAILRDERRILPLSVNAKGFHGIEDDIYLSLPMTLESTGAYKIINSVINRGKGKVVQIRRDKEKMQDLLRL